MKHVRSGVTVVVATMTAVALSSPAEAADVGVGFTAYSAETYLADTVAQEAAHASLATFATSAAAASDIAEANGGEGGNSSPSCSATTYKPRGHFNESTSTAYVDVTTDVWCNFTPRQIVVKVILQGYEGARSVNHPSSDVTCTGVAVCSATAYYSRYLYCDENFHFEHYGVPYGSYQLKNGSWRRIVGDGVRGPSTSGGGYRWC